MKGSMLCFLGGAVWLLLSCPPVRAWCPEDPGDSGTCDTMYVEVYPPDTLFSGLVRVPIYVTHDMIDPYEDSLTGFIIPLCFTHTNPTKYCSLTYQWNNTTIYPFPDSLLERSIFRHFIENGDTVAHNWMMDLSQRGSRWAWENRMLFLDGNSYFWFEAYRRTWEEQCLGAESRALLATLTFNVEDTMTICLDSCTMPPQTGLHFLAKWSRTFTPRHDLPCCFSLTYPALGDVNADGVIDAGDVIRLVNYLYRGDSHPVPVPVGDVNCDGVVDGGDVVFLINYLFRGGPEPSC